MLVKIVPIKIIDIPDEAYSMVMSTTFTEDSEIMFKQNAEDRRKTLQLFVILDSIKDGKPYEETSKGEWVRKEDVIHSIAKQYSEHNELVPIWLSIGDMKGGAE